MTTQIFVAWGCEIRDSSNQKAMVKYLNTSATAKGTNRWVTKKGSTDYEICLIYKKDEFQAALDSDEAIVIYDGHSRFGQGPAFGEAVAPDTKMPDCPDKTRYPTNPWGNSFRMGWDAIDLPLMEDVFEHCTDPPEYPAGKPPKSPFVDKAVTWILSKTSGSSSKCETNFAWRPMSTCFPVVAKKANGRGDKTLYNRHFWRAKTKMVEFDSLVTVGSADLDKSKLACRVLFMNSCSSMEHFYAALKRQKTKVGSNCVFYVTSQVCSAGTSLIFLKKVLGGLNPYYKKDSVSILKAMNGLKDAGFIKLLT